MAARTMPTMPTWLAGQKITSTLLNQGTTYAQFWADPPSFRMYQSTNQAFTTGVEQQLTCDTPLWDSDAGRSGTTPYSYTIPAGWGSGMRWTFSYSSCWTASATGTRWIYLKVNGTAVINSRFQIPGGGDPVTVGGTCSTTCNSGDVVAVWTGQSSGGNLATSIANNNSFFEGWLHGLGSP